MAKIKYKYIKSKYHKLMSGKSIHKEVIRLGYTIYKNLKKGKKIEYYKEDIPNELPEWTEWTIDDEIYVDVKYRIVRNIEG